MMVSSWMRAGLLAALFAVLAGMTWALQAEHRYDDPRRLWSFAVRRTVAMAVAGAVFWQYVWPTEILLPFAWMLPCVVSLWSRRKGPLVGAAFILADEPAAPAAGLSETALAAARHAEANAVLPPFLGIAATLVVVAAVFCQTVGERPEDPAVMVRHSEQNWLPDFRKRRPEVSDATIEKYFHSLWRVQPDFLYSVSRDFIANCPKPILVLPDDTPSHPLQTSIDVASLAPNAEITVFPWRDPPELKARTIERVRRFLKTHLPG